MRQVLRLLAEGGGEAVGSAFEKILRHALSPLHAPKLLRAAARYDLEPHRLRFLRRTLSRLSMVTGRWHFPCHPRPLAAAPPLWAGRAWRLGVFGYSQGEESWPPGAPPPPRLLERAACNGADLTAFDRAGAMAARPAATSLRWAAYSAPGCGCWRGAAPRRMQHGRSTPWLAATHCSRSQAPSAQRGYPTAASEARPLDPGLHI